ncbi:MAG: metallophosphoesterase [Halieaceae bacterium]
MLTQIITRLLLALTVGITTMAQAGSLQTDTESRVVAFADVHGAYHELTTLLREVEVINAADDWIGGDTHLVSLGDLIDRGQDSRKVVELLIKLEQQAMAAGGAVHVVLGNHEVMVMSGDLRYVSRAEYAAFADDETAADREALFAEWWESQPELAEAEARAGFDRLFPPGYLGLQKAYAPNGHLGSWLMQKPLVIRVNDRLYMHGGIASVIAESSLEVINGDNKRELADYLSVVESLRDAGQLARYVDFWGRRDYLNSKAEAILAVDPKARPAWFEDFLALTELEQAFVFTPESPIWYRGNAYCHPYAESFNTERILKRTGTRQLVLGHTPDPRGASQRLDGQVLRLDTGMLKAVYKGKPTAYILEGDKSWLHYAGDSEAAQPFGRQRSISKELWGQTDAELEDLLLNGAILSSEFIGTGVTKPKRLTLRKGEVEDYAVFKYEDTEPGLETRKSYIGRRHNDADRYQYDPAAYRLDRMIDLQMVPVSVIRSVDGEEGTVGAWIPNALNERDRLEQEIAFTGFCAQDEQYRLRFLFDILIYNEDRNLTNIIWTRKDFMLRFIDHSLAFRSTERRPKQYRKVTLRLSDLFRERLLALDEASLSAELSAWLHPRQIEAIIARRDLILKEAVRTDP